MDRQEGGACRPYLAQFAVPRTGSAEIPGRYDPVLDVWVLTVDGKETPIAAAGMAMADAGPITKVKGERDNLLLSSIRELSTKTAHRVESDDHAPTVLTALDTGTRTFTLKEADDLSAAELACLLELGTKTAQAPERDD